MRLNFIGWILLVTLIFTPVGQWLTSTMTTHMLLLYPGLIMSGCLIAWPYRNKGLAILESVNSGGIAGILTASFTLAFWMIPKWIDHSLTHSWLELAKYLCLTFLVGSVFILSWTLLHPLLKALVKIEFLTMLLRLGWIYLISPDRLCNNYLLSDQVYLGKGLLYLAALLAFYWVIPLFIVQKSATRYSINNETPMPWER